MSLELNDNLKDFAKDSLVRKALQEIQDTVSSLPASDLYYELYFLPVDIFNLATNPIQVLPALPSGQYFRIKETVLEYTLGGTPYQWDDSTDSFILNGKSGICDFGKQVIAGNSAFAKGLYVQTQNQVVMNNAVYFGTKNEDTSPINGDGYMRLRLWYTLETLV